MQRLEDEIPYVVVRHAIVVLDRTCWKVRRDWITDEVKCYPSRCVGTAGELRSQRPRFGLLLPAGAQRSLRFALVGPRGGHCSRRLVLASFVDGVDGVSVGVTNEMRLVGGW